MTRIASTATLTASIVALLVVAPIVAVRSAGIAVHGAFLSDWTVFVRCSRIELSEYSEMLVPIQIWQIAAILILAASLSYGITVVYQMLGSRAAHVRRPAELP